jgi:subtilisin family serine protease
MLLRSPINRFSGIFTLILLAILLGCGGGGGGMVNLDPGGSASAPVAPELNPNAPSHSLAEVLAELDALQSPGVDPVNFKLMRDGLRQALSASGTDKFTVSAPLGEDNAVSDLATIDAGETGTLLTWRERNTGDYDSNSEVSVSDITVIAEYFGKTLYDADWNSARLADGDGNGEVNVSDISPIAEHLFQHVSGYRVFRAPDEQSDAELVGEVRREDARRDVAGWPLYEFTDATAQAGQQYVYYVRPFSEHGGNTGQASGILTITGGSTFGRAHGKEVITVNRDGIDTPVLGNELLICFTSKPAPERLFEVVYNELHAELMGQVPGTFSYRVWVDGPHGRNASSVMANKAASSAGDYSVEYDILMEPFDWPGLEAMEPFPVPDPADFSKSASATVNDALRGQLWGLDKVQANTAWDTTTGGGVKICVIDTGCYVAHEDIPDSTVGTRIGDDGTYPQWNLDLEGHGTHVAGTIAAIGNNAIGVVGLAYGCSLYFVRAGNIYSGNWGFPESDTAAGLNWARTNGCKVVNLSLGGTSPWGTTGQTALANCETAGVCVVAAAGNDSSSAVHYPAGHTNVLSVGSSTFDDRRSSFSNYGISWVDVCAPGGGTFNGANTYCSTFILSCMGDGDSQFPGDPCGDGTKYVRKVGTSMACPHVAALAGMIYAVSGSLTPAQVRSTIYTTGDTIADSGTIGPRINAAAALASLTPGYGISGTVRDASNNGLSGVTVTLGGDGSGTTTTASNGTYSFSGLADGDTFTVTPSKAGWRYTPASITGLTLSGANITGQNFIGAPNLISGTITLSGSGFNAVTVTLRQGAAVIATTTTNSSGNYSFIALANATYTVTPTKSGYHFTNASESVVVNSDDHTSVNFTAAANTLSGHIQNSGGTPLVGISVSLSGSGSGSTTTNASGDYTFSAVPNGSCTITPTNGTYAFTPVNRTATVADNTTSGLDFTGTASFTISGTIANSGAGVSVAIGAYTTVTTNASGAYTATVPDGASYNVVPTKSGWRFTPANQNVSVSGANQPNINFTGAANTISGTVTLSGSGLGSVTLTLKVGAVTYATATSAANGTYTFTAVPNNSYTLTASRTGYRFAPVSRAITVNSDDYSGQDFTATANVITGHIQTGGGTPIAGVTVGLTGSGTGTTTTNASGDYTFTAVANGNYTITPTSGTYAFTPVNRSATISDGDSTSNNFTGTASYVISGTISGSGAGVSVAIGGYTTVTTNSSGFYTATVPDGASYNVVPTKTGWRFTPANQNVTVSGANQLNINFTGAANTISGNAKDDLGANLAGVIITLSGVGTTSTNASGNYSFTGVPNAVYTIAASKAGYSFSTLNVTVSNDDHPNQNFTGDANVVSGNIQISGGGGPLTNVVVTLAGVDSDTTDASGDFSIRGVPNGTYSLSPHLGNWTFNPVFYSVTINNNDAAGKDFTAIPFTLDVSGTITLSDGSPLNGVTVTIDNGAGYTDSTITFGSGGYIIVDVPEGDYTLTPTYAGYGFAPSDRTISVYSQDLDGQNFIALPGSFAVSGTVALSDSTPVAGVTMTLAGVGTATTAADGTYSFASVPAGVHLLTPSLAGYSFSPASRNLNVLGNMPGQNFTATADGNPPGSYSVSGTVSRDTGAGVAGVSMTLVLNGSGLSYGPIMTGVTGYFQFTAIPPGAYTLSPYRSGNIFLPNSRAVTVVASSLIGQDFTMY